MKIITALVLCLVTLLAGAQTSQVALPHAVANSIVGTVIPDTGNTSVVVSQTGLPAVYPPSGYIDATGNLVIGQNPPASATMYLSSSTAGSGITITFNAATLTGTAAGDTNRVVTINDGAGVYKTFLITGNTGASTTIAQGTLNTTLTTACAVGTPCAITKVWVSGTSAATNTAGAGVTYSVALLRTYPNAYVYLPASSAVASANWFYAVCSYTTTCVVYNNVVGSNIGANGTPLIPGTLTAFAGLTPGAYTQTTSTLIYFAPGISIPANSMGLNGEAEFRWMQTANTSAGAKTCTLLVGGSAIFGGEQLTTGLYNLNTADMRNAGVANVQNANFWYANNASGSFTNLGNASAAVNTASGVTVQWQFNQATATDYLAIEGYSVKVSPN
jgi:hypothetical protein